jgi:putative hydrolase of HD superfamily
LESLVKFWRYGAGLKLVERKGWKKFRVKRRESVAEHSFALALLAMLEADRRGYDVERVLRLALLHDLEEAITGDLTPRDKELRGGSRVLRDKRKAIGEIVRRLPGKRRGYYRELWLDLRLLQTREARLVHELDKLEMVLQASVYAKKIGRSRVLDFYSSAGEGIHDPVLRRILNSVVRGS